MLESLVAAENQLFTIALAIMLLITLVEGLSALLGSGLFGFLDSLIPEFDADIDTDIDVNSSPSFFTQLLGWLHIGQVPILMLLIIFLTAFGLFGLAFQSVYFRVFDSYLPTWMVAWPTFVLALMMVKAGGNILANVMPQDETDAVSEESFVGRTAQVTLGVASPGSPAEAKLIDEFGNTHYVMVEPKQDETFSTGSHVLITDKRGAVFSCISNDTDVVEI